MKEWIWGRNPIFEALRANKRRAYQMRVAKGVTAEGRLGEILRLAEKKGIPITSVPRDSLNGLSTHHQGIALQVDEYPYVDLDLILSKARDQDEPPLILILDTLKDPQNLGSLIRTAELVGVHGVVLPFRQTATVTPAVVSASSGATEHSLITQANLAQTLTILKEAGLWVVGLEGGKGAQPPDKVNLNGPLAVVVGSEAEGMRRLVKESCDFLLRLPMRGEIDSLNAAVAGSVALYLIWQARAYLGADR
ncbi:MAG: 23S rRNA (guanosine(2251)-2'-O)-methyltransferase RlmB [Anaerolineales bacterium]|nr:23S rRNA (guanosine(2251)-2'-O)-methyltransferase RlmB [Anaerolineales bacterium]